MHVNKKKKKTSKNSPPKKLYLVNHWAGYITSPGLHERLLWQSSRPSRWHPQHMWHDLLQRGYTGAPSHCANSRQGPQMCVAPLGHGSRMRCPSLCSSADAPHNCQAFSFIRPRSDTYRGVQPEAITAASLRCGHTHTRTCTDIYIDTCTFGIISKKEPISSVERCDGEGFLLFFFQFRVLNMCMRGDKTLVTWRSQWMCMNTEIFSWTQRRKFVSSLTKLRWKPAIYRNVIQACIYLGVRSSKHKSQGRLFFF